MSAAGEYPLSVVAIEKVSSLAFIDAVLNAHEQHQVVLPLASDASPPAGVAVVAHIAVAPGGGWFYRSARPSRDNAPAQISLSSGTTASPKAVLLTHRSLADVTDRLVEVMALDSSIREYVGVPVTFSFGFGRVRAIAAVGGAAYLPERGFRIDEFAGMLERGEVNALSAVPTLLRLVLMQEARLREAGKRLRWLEIGSQTMSADEKRAVRALFPNAQIVQHYGLTEASRTTFLRISDADDAALETVGRPNGGVEIRIDNTGRICIRGANVASGIVTDRGLVQLADDAGWLTTNDLGRLTDSGLIYDGRADHLINVGGIKIPAELFEERMRSLVPPQTALAIAGGLDPLRGELVVIAHESSIDRSSLATLCTVGRQIAAELGVADGVALFAMDFLPLTETGKIRRREISVAYATRPQLEDVPTLPEVTGGSAGVIQAFSTVFGARVLEESASFDSLGGDSLHYVSMLLSLEQAVPRLPDDWDMQSIGALAALAAEQVDAGIGCKAPRRIPNSLDTVRGLACVLIVALHVVGLGPTEGLRLADGSPWHSIMEVLTIVRLPLFTAISGYLYAALPATRTGFGPFMARKLRQLLIPLLFATLAFWTLRSLTYGFKDSLLWAYVDGYQHLWFIDALLLIFAAVAFLDVRSRGGWPWALLLAAIAAGWWAVPSVPVLHLKNAVFLLPYFVVGMLLYRKPWLLESNRICAGAALVAVATLALLEVPHLAALIGSDRSGLLRWICGSAWVVTLLRFLPKILPLEAIAAFSFTIYLWHPAANGVVRNVLWKLGLHSTAGLFLIGLAVGVGLPILMHRVALRLPRAFRMPLIGR